MAEEQGPEGLIDHPLPVAATLAAISLLAQAPQPCSGTLECSGISFSNSRDEEGETWIARRTGEEIIIQVQADLSPHLSKATGTHLVGAEMCAGMAEHHPRTLLDSLEAGGADQLAAMAEQQQDPARQQLTNTIKMMVEEEDLEGSITAGPTALVIDLGSRQLIALQDQLWLLKYGSEDRRPVSLVQQGPGLMLMHQVLRLSQQRAEARRREAKAVQQLLERISWREGPA